MEELSTDILVIGGGLAGMVAALEANRPGLRVLLVAKFSIGMGTNSSLASTFTAANSRFSEEDHYRATIEAGRGLNLPSLVRSLADRGRNAIERLRKYGLPLIEKGNGYALDRPARASELPGVILMRNLREKAKERPIGLLPGLTVFDLVVEEGQALGAFGFYRDGRPYLIRSKCVILATGGGGALYRRNDNQRSILGDGYALALRAGLRLFDLEFVQFYPLVLAEPRLSSFILLPPYPEQMRLINSKGDDLLKKMGIEENLSRTAMTQRDRLSVLLFEASQEEGVYCDLTRVPEQEWDLFPFNFLKKSKFPFKERPFLVGPAAHFFMGGLETDGLGRTDLPGLFAAGEVTWGLHGANRLGGNALTECVVFGRLAAKSAVRYCQKASSPKNEEAIRRRWEKKAKSYLRKRRHSFDHPKDLLKQLQSLAWKFAGPVREEALLKEGLVELRGLERKVENISPTTVKDLFRKRELENGVLILKAILRGSLYRRESRGAFYRRDLPERDDTVWLKSTCYEFDQGEFKITSRPIPTS